MYVDIVISNAFNLNKKHFLFFFLFLSSFPSVTLFAYRPVIALFGLLHKLFSLCCIQYYEVQRMRDIPPRVSEEQLQGMQVTPYHKHYSVNSPRHLIHSIRTCCLDVMV